MTRDEAICKWDRAENALAEATEEHRACFFAIFPVGAEAFQHHGENLIHVTVIEHHDWLEILRVRGRTGRKYWLGGGRMAIPRGPE